MVTASRGDSVLIGPEAMTREQWQAGKLSEVVAVEADYEILTGYWRGRWAAPRVLRAQVPEVRKPKGKRVLG